MKAFAREMVLVVESVLFWMVALPLALFSWPLLVLTETMRNLFFFNDNLQSQKAMPPRLTYHPARL